MMKLTVVEDVAAVKGGSTVGALMSGQAGIDAVFTTDKVIVSMGRLLAQNGYAAIVAGGGGVQLKAVGGLPVAMEYQVIGLESINVWGCPACGSAHGSAVGVSYKKHSPNPSAKRLATVEFYYVPATKRLFSVSEKCFDQYVKPTHAARVVRFDQYKAAPKK